jgi:hypothetical protein
LAGVRRWFCPGAFGSCRENDSTLNLLNLAYKFCTSNAVFNDNVVNCITVHNKDSFPSTLIGNTMLDLIVDNTLPWVIRSQSCQPNYCG